MRRYAWTLVAGCLALWICVAGVINLATQSSYNRKLERTEQRAHFWRAVGGSEGTFSPTVDDKLAADIRDWVRAGHSIAQFEGDSNSYGGIGQALGDYDPFDQSCGQECGHLRADAQRKALASYEGQSRQVIESEQPAKPSNISWTVPAALFVLWLLVGLAVLYLPPLMRRHEQEQELSGAYPAEARMIGQIDRAMAELPPGSQQWDQMNQLRVGLEKAVTRRLNAGENEIQQARTRRLMEEASSMLYAMNEGNEAL